MEKWRRSACAAYTDLQRYETPNSHDSIVEGSQSIQLSISPKNKTTDSMKNLNGMPLSFLPFSASTVGGSNKSVSMYLSQHAPLRSA